MSIKKSTRPQIKLEISETDLEVIAEQIKEGYTSGILDGEEGESQTRTQTRISWELTTNKFEL